MSVRSAERALETLLQLVLDGVETGDAALIPQAVIQLGTLEGIIQELPLTTVTKVDITSRLDQAQVVLQNPALSLTVAERFSAVLQILQVVTLKIQNLNICCC